MIADELLVDYLNDHRGRGLATLSLAERAASEPGATKALREVAVSIEADLDELEHLMDWLGIHKDTRQAAAGWAADQLRQIRLSERMVGSAEVAQLLEAEALVLGTQALSTLWATLEGISQEHPRLAEIDFERLLRHATEQRAEAERHRAALAARVFAVEP